MPHTILSFNSLTDKKLSYRAVSLSQDAYFMPSLRSHTPATIYFAWLRCRSYEAASKFSPNTIIMSIRWFRMRHFYRHVSRTLWVKIPADFLNSEFRYFIFPLLISFIISLHIYFTAAYFLGKLPLYYYYLVLYTIIISQGATRCADFIAAADFNYWKEFVGL
jgi:hypothetical protein